jgi:Putative MetA-pathway of phenol degradation
MWQTFSLGHRIGPACRFGLVSVMVCAGLCGLSTRGFGQAPDQAANPRAELLEASPNRPSSSNSADVLEPGVLQWEYGWSREWGAEGDRQSAFGGELRFGLRRSVEFRWGGDSHVSVSNGIGGHDGFGDQYFSGQFRFKQQSTRAPALALSYAIKVPTADESQGLGSGRVDHTFAFLLSEEVHKISCDFNADYQAIGQEGASGFDQNGALILTFQRSVYGPLSLIGEVGGQTRLHAQTPAFATTLWAVTYKVHRQVVLDTALDVGITNGAPHKRILFGFTYAVANLYARHGER